MDTLDLASDEVADHYGWCIYFDENGNPPAKTKWSHPYSYDSFTSWLNPTATPNESVYSDRLIQWDFDKHDDLCMKHFGNKGQYWSERSPKKIQQFLRDYFNKPELILCEIIEGCNVSNGYPYWCFRFKSGEEG